ncbi:hypothetical protein [Streptomyces sp. NPDC058614]|uniref:hypothetical protein n=1 Tax=Streptomyces sp. NPDC058614 TaxID=3346557 RepID=UPI003663873C
MKIAIGCALNIAPAGHDWVVSFDLGGETEKVVCPVIGWATVVRGHLNDGTTTTDVRPAFLWDQQVWTEMDLIEHAPTHSDFEIRVREIPGAEAARARREELEADVRPDSDSDGFTNLDDFTS